MIEVKIGLDGVPSPNKIVLGNRWENNDEKIHFDVPVDFDSYNKYVIGVMKQSTGNQTVVLPVKDNIMYVSSDLTYLNGNWNLYLMCRQGTLDLENEEIDLGAQNDEHVFISDGFIGTVNKNMIEQDAIENIPLDTNLQIVYDELMALKKNILDQINGGNKEKEEVADTVPIYRVDVKSFSALYKAVKTIGLSLDEDDVSTFLFALMSNEVESSYNGKFIELNIMKIYRAEYNPYTKQAVVSCDDFALTVKAEGVVGYEEYSQGSSGDIDISLLDAKLDIDQGVDNAGKVLAVGDDGRVALVNSYVVATVNEPDLDSMLEEVYGNG